MGPVMEIGATDKVKEWSREHRLCHPSGHSDGQTERAGGGAQRAPC